MADSTGWGERRKYRPDSGYALREDGTTFDVTNWMESQSISRNGQTHVRGYDPTSHRLLTDILNELKKISLHLSIITDEEIN